MRGEAGGRLQTLGAGFLVLAVTVAAPALSAAQDDGADAPGAPPPTTPGPGSEGEVQPEAAEPAEQAVTSEGATVTAPAPAGGGAEKEPRARPAADRTVSVGDNFYKPRTITIDVGDTVTWRNDGRADHTATADNGSFDTGTFGPGERRSETFSEAGNVPYYCIIHGTAQSGTIKVRSASGGGAGGGGGDGGGSGGADTSSSGSGGTFSSSGGGGSGSSLPATGFAALVLAGIGLGLVASGSLLRRLDGARRGSRLFSL